MDPLATATEQPSGYGAVLGPPLPPGPYDGSSCAREVTVGCGAAHVRPDQSLEALVDRLRKSQTDLSVVNWVSVCDLDRSSSHQLYRIALASLALYFLAAIFFFSLNEDWTVVDAAYFAVVTLSTVGYGDLHPDTDAEKLFALLLAFGAVSFLAAALGTVLGDFVTKAVDPDRKRSTPLRIVGALVGRLCLIVLAGAVPYSYLEDQRWADAVYWAGVTVTTVGYGDACPKTYWGRAFAVGYIFLGTVLCARALSHLASLPMQLRQQRLEEAVERQFGPALSRSAFSTIARQLSRLHIRTPGTQAITQAEFILGMFVSLGRITEEDIQVCAQQFQALDHSCNGLLDEEDIATVRQASCAP
eukprot:EG_transcript_12787